MKRGRHWLLTDADAKDYGQKLVNALRHIPVTMAQKYVDFTALGAAVFTYESPRIMMDMQLKAQRQRRPPPFGPAQIFQFRSPSPGPGGEAQAERTNQPAQAGPIAGNRYEGPAPDMTYEPDISA